MKKLYLYIFLITLSLLSACSTKTPVYIDANVQESVRTPATFAVKTLGKVYYKNGKEEIKIGDILKKTITEELKKYHVYDNTSPQSNNYIIIIADIVDYTPGNAFGRWALGGLPLDTFKSSIKVDAYICKLTKTDKGDIIGQRLAYISKTSLIDQGFLGGIQGWEKVIEVAGTEIAEGFINAFIKK